MASSFLPCATLFLAAASTAITSGQSLLATVGLAVALLWAWVVLRRTKSRGGAFLSLLFALAAGFVLGWRASNPEFGPSHVARSSGLRSVRVVARVVSAERRPGGGSMELEALGVGPKGEERPATGRVLVRFARQSRSVAPGCRVAFASTLRRPANFGNPGGFDYESYLARRGIFVRAFLWDDSGIEILGCSPGLLEGALERWRGKVRKAILSRGGRREGPVLLAMVLGDRPSVATQVREQMIRAGVAHVLAISGLHVGLVFGAAYWTLRWVFSRRIGFLLSTDVSALAMLGAFLPASGYAFLAGGRISTLRALIMIAAMAMASLAGRPTRVLRALAHAALLLVIANPLVLTDPSFQLSFASVLGIVAVAKKIAWRREGGACLRLFRLAASSFLVSLAATLATAPIAAAHFQRVSLIAPLANLAVLPLLGPGAVVPAVAAAFLVPLSEKAASLPLLAARYPVRLGLYLTEAFSTPRLAAWSSFVPTQTEIVLYYACLGLLFFGRDLRPEWRRVALCLCLFALSCDCGFWIWRRHFDWRLHVTFLSVGQGDAAVVEFPGGRTMVIDAGPKFRSGFDTGERVVTPFLKSRKIARLDYLVVSHAQMDHCGGAAALIREFSPVEIWWNGVAKQGCIEPSRLKALPHAPRLLPVRRGMEREIGGVRLRVCHPAINPEHLSENDRSVVLSLVHRSVSFAFTGDIEAAAERSILSSGCLGSSTVLKAPHHGSATSSTPLFVETLGPRLVVFSAGRGNRFGFPRPQVSGRYRRSGAKILRTDVEGAIEVISNGRSYSVCTGRRIRRCRAAPPLTLRTGRGVPAQALASPRRSSLSGRSRR